MGSFADDVLGIDDTKFLGIKKKNIGNLVDKILPDMGRKDLAKAKKNYEEDTAKGYHYIGEDHSIYLQLFIEELEVAMEGIHYIPEDLRGPIIKANQAYVEVAREANLL